MFTKQGGRWVVTLDYPSLSITDWWSKGQANNTWWFTRSEKLFIKDYDASKEGAVECNINKEDAQFYYYYEWYKTASQGVWRKTPKNPNQPSTNYDDYLSYFEQMPDLLVTRYPDARVDGQDCFVYSLQYSGQTMFFWFSKTKGFDILYQIVLPGSQQVYASYTYESKRVNTNDDFYDHTKQGVTTWIDQSY